MAVSHEGKVWMFLVIGLGNPGKKYQKTRHNLGFRIVENLALNWNIEFKKGNGPYLYIQTTFGSQDVFIAKPTTYMNRIGQAVKKICSEQETELSQLLVLCDDCNLPLGKLRIREKGSAGGHNGLASIINTLGTDEFPRMRLGIGYNKEMNMKNYVLSPFLSTEISQVNEMIKKGSQGIIDFVLRGIDWTMNYYNG